MVGDGGVRGNFRSLRGFRGSNDANLLLLPWGMSVIGTCGPEVLYWSMAVANYLLGATCI